MAQMDKTVIVVSAVSGSLGLLSAILGFAAEGANGNVTSYYRRNGSSSSAAGLGFGAAIFLLAAQITVSAVSSCCGCCKSRAIPSETKRIVGIVCAVFSWILAVIAFVLFLGGRGCQGAFAAGGVLTLVATALGVTSFIKTRGQPADATPTVAPAPDATTMPTVAPAVTKVNAKPRELQQQQQQPPVMVVVDPRLSTATKIAEDAQNKPGHEQPPRTEVVAVDQQQHTVVAMEHQRPQPAAAVVDTTTDKTGEPLPPHAVVTTREQLPRVPLDPYQVLQQNHVQAQDEQPLLQQPQFLPSPHHQVVYMIVQQPQETNYPAGQPQVATVQQPMFVTSTMGAHQTSPQVYVMQQPPIGTPQLPVAEPHQVPVQPPPPAVPQPQQQTHYHPVQPMFPTPTTSPPPVYFVPQPSMDVAQFTADQSPQVPAQPPLPATTAPTTQQGQRQETVSTVFCKELTKAGIRLGARALKETLFSDNTNSTSSMDFIASAMTGSAAGGGDDVRATESGDAAAYG